MADVRIGPVRTVCPTDYGLRPCFQVVRTSSKCAPRAVRSTTPVSQVAHRHDAHLASPLAGVDH